MDTKELIRERVQLHEENKALIEKAAKERRQLTGEEQEQFDRRDGRMTELRKLLDQIAKVEQEDRILAESRGRQTETTVSKTGNEISDRDRDLALRAWALGPKRRQQISRSMLEAAQRVGLDYAQAEVEGYLDAKQRQAAAEQRALSVGTTDAGGYSVPDEMMLSFVEVQKWYGRVDKAATVLNTTTGAALPIPRTDDTANTGEIIAEAGAVTTTADPVFGQVVLDAYKYSSKALIVSVELLQDSSINLPQYLGRALGTRLGRIRNTHFTTGDGSSKPLGIVTASSLGKTAAATNAITWDEIIDLQHSVDIAYRDRPNFGLMMHDTVAAYLRKLKDSQNRYLWELSLQAGIPDRALGMPVTINNDMSATFATNNRLVIAGDFESYHVRNAGPVVFARADELRILNHQVVFLAFQRSDGDLPDVTAVRYLRTA